MGGRCGNEEWCKMRLPGHGRPPACRTAVPLRGLIPEAGVTPRWTGCMDYGSRPGFASGQDRGLKDNSNLSPECSKRFHHVSQFRMEIRWMVSIYSFAWCFYRHYFFFSYLF
jgi:hypothetical protein